MSQIEHERKFHIERGARVPGLGPDFVLGKRRRSRMTATYVDTPDLLLARAHITLRRRTGGGDEGWHLKLPQGDETRVEVHAGLHEGPAAARIPTDLREHVADVVGQQPLVPVAVMRTDRTERDISTKRGRHVGTLTDDTVSVGSWSPDDEEPGDEQKWRELEVEVASTKKADLDALEKITGLLNDAGIEVSDSASKVGRFLDDQVAEAEADDEGMSPEDAAGDVVMEYIQAQLGVMQAREKELVEDETDAVHKSRVASRRLRSALRTGRKLFDSDVTEPLRAEVRWWGKVLGGPRDAEVIRDLLLSSLDELDDDQVVGPVRERMERELADEHARAHSEAVAMLASQRYTELKTRLAALVTDPPFRKKADKPAEKVLPDLTKDAVERVDKNVKKAKKAPEDEREHWLHETRKKAKAARYLGESLVPALGKKPKKMADRYEDVTDSLGEMQDTVVVVERLEAIRAKAAEAGEPTDTYDTLIARQHEERERAEAEGVKALKETAKPKKRRWFEG